MLSAARRAAGYSLIELAVAGAILGAVLLYVFDTFTVQHQTYSVVEQVAETQQNARALAGLIERNLRGAGYMVPPAAAACGQDSTSQPDALFISDTNAILPVDQLEEDLRSKELSATVQSTAVSGTVVTFTIDDVVLDESDTYDANGTGTADSDFQYDAGAGIAGGAILVDVANPDRGVACGVITAVDTSFPQKVSVDLGTTSLGGTATFPADLRLIPAIAYTVVPPTTSTPGQLRRNGQTIAYDVEDLQVAWFYDDNAAGTPGQIDAGEYRATGGVAYTTSAVDGNDLREVRFNIVAQTRADDMSNPTAAGTGQSTENRTTSVAGDDGRRRRVHTSTIRLRNIPMS